MNWAIILPLAVEGFKGAAALYAAIRNSMKQTGEWTDDMEASYQADLEAAKTAPHWKPDPLPPVP